VAVSAVNWPLAIWLKRQFRNFGFALGACPITLVHLSLAKTALPLAKILLIVHGDDLFVFC
jgi:hypothetical protein